MSKLAELLDEVQPGECIRMQHDRDRDERLVRALGVLFDRSSEEIENAADWVRGESERGGE